MAIKSTNQSSQVFIQAPATDTITLAAEALSISRDVATGIRIDAMDLLSEYGKDQAKIILAATKTGEIFSDEVMEAVLELAAVLEEIILDGTTSTARCQEADEVSSHLVWMETELDPDAKDASRCLTVLIGWRVALEAVRDRMLAKEVIGKMLI